MVVPAGTRTELLAAMVIVVPGRTVEGVAAELLLDPLPPPHDTIAEITNHIKTDNKTRRINYPPIEKYNRQCSMLSPNEPV
jgi:hypothetical protein